MTPEQGAGLPGASPRRAGPPSLPGGDWRGPLRWLLAATFIGAGVLHFRATNTYLKIMPPYLPLAWHRPLVLASGAAEIAGGLGLLVPRLRRAAGWGLILLLVAVFPANVEMARRGVFVAPLWGWLRLPFQAVFVAWVYWCAARGRKE